MPFERESSDVCENLLARKFLEGRWTEAPIGKGADRGGEKTEIVGCRDLLATRALFNQGARVCAPPSSLDPCGGITREDI